MSSLICLILSMSQTSFITSMFMPVRRFSLTLPSLWGSLYFHSSADQQKLPLYLNSFFTHPFSYISLNLIYNKVLSILLLKHLSVLSLCISAFLGLCHISSLLQPLPSDHRYFSYTLISDVALYSKIYRHTHTYVYVSGLWRSVTNILFFHFLRVLLYIYFQMLCSSLFS